ncbi:undecaprenyl-diphosphate phosphatase, partial [Pseudomonas viridiflava]|uniref:undecaprenyl-diphosphate phosphatase n=1 Tax=Pseudomonas viridiflava TaxID=33069 RepID=UPI0024075A29
MCAFNLANVVFDSLRGMLFVTLFIMAVSRFFSLIATVSLAFNIIIQLGAILAVVWEFRRKILDVVTGLPKQRQAQRFTINLLIAFLPAVVLGVIFADLIHEYLFN